MKRFLLSLSTLSATFLALTFSTAQAAPTKVTFDEVALAPESFNNGSTYEGPVRQESASWDPSFVLSYYDIVWEFGGAEFPLTYNLDFGSWNGFVVSNTTDIETPGFANQYSSFPGGGASADDASTVSGDVFGVAFASSPLVVTLPEDSPTPLRIDITNTTFAGLSMQLGDFFAKQFGGPEGTDPDFFTLTIEGLNEAEEVTGHVEVALADFTSAVSEEDFILDTWERVDLSDLGAEVAALRFSLESSDVGAFGINTPTYFAFDNLTFGPNWLSEAVTVGEGWKWVEWIGYYNDSTFPWVVHDEHGWLYVVPTSSTNWAWDMQLGWLILDRRYYPLMYNANSASWLYYLSNGPEGRTFYVVGGGEWIVVPTTEEG